MQFLEFITRRLMGSPAYSKTWVCPWCDSDKPSLSLNPPKDGCETKLRCFNCGKLADAFDLARYFRSDVRWPERIALVQGWERDYARLSAEDIADESTESVGPVIPNGDQEGDSAARNIAWVTADAQATFAEWGLSDDQARRVIHYLSHFCTGDATVQAVAETWETVAEQRQRIRRAIRKTGLKKPPTPKR